MNGSKRRPSTVDIKEIDANGKRLLCIVLAYFNANVNRRL